MPLRQDEAALTNEPTGSLEPMSSGDPVDEGSVDHSDFLLQNIADAFLARNIVGRLVKAARLR